MLHCSIKIISKHDEEQGYWLFWQKGCACATLECGNLYWRLRFLVAEAISIRQMIFMTWRYLHLLPTQLSQCDKYLTIDSLKEPFSSVKDI